MVNFVKVTKTDRNVPCALKSVTSITIPTPKVARTSKPIKNSGHTNPCLIMTARLFTDERLSQFLVNGNTLKLHKL